MTYRVIKKCKPYVLLDYTHQDISIFNILPGNLLPVKKETYYSKIKVIGKEKQDSTILATELNDLKMTLNVISKTFIKFYL